MISSAAPQLKRKPLDGVYPEGYIGGSIIPFADLTPSNCQYLAREGAYVLDILATWGLEIVPSAKIASAIAHLRAVADSDSYGPKPEGWIITAEAIETVVDWSIIVGRLTATPIASVAAELREALERGGGSVSSGNVVTQLWFGSLLALTGFRPAIPSTSRRRPDFVIHADGMELALEVKRPASLHATMRAIKDGARQIRDFGEPGFLAVDLSLALDVRSAAMGYYDAPYPARIAFEAHFLTSARAISERLRGYRGVGKFNKIIGLFLYAKLHAWHSTESPGLRMSLFVEASVFPMAAAGILQDTAVRVTRTLREGLGQITARPVVPLP